MAKKDRTSRPATPLRTPSTINRPLETKSISLDEAQELTHIGTWQWDVASGDIIWSDELYRIYGLEPREKAISYEEFMQLIHPDDRERVGNLIQEAYKSKRPFEFEHRIVLPNEKIRILEGKGKVVTDADNNVVRMLGTSQDITERKKAERALHQSDERFRAVSAATNDIIYDVDLESGLMWYNDVLRTEYQYPQGDETLYAREWGYDRIHPEDRQRVLDSVTTSLASPGNTWACEYRFRKHNGTYTDVRDRAFILRDVDQKPTRLIGSMLDITHQKDLERAKDRFISLVSHQLRTPLTSMHLLAEMLASGYADKLTTSQEDYVQKIGTSTERMINLVNEILDLSNIESGKLRTHLKDTDMRALIQGQIDEVTPLATERRIAVTYTPSKNAQVTALDPVLFSQILHNLLTNAIRYTPQAGATVHVTCRKKENEFIVAVKDQGIGIPKEAWPHLFSSFYRANNAIKTHGDGTGLGLYLAKLILDITGGKIWFDSEEGKGTTFYVSLPISGMKKSTNSDSARHTKERANG